MSLAEAPFEVVASRTRGEVVVAIRGELDTYTAPRLRSQLRALILDQVTHTVVLDLSRMTFIDSSGLGVLVGALKWTRGQGGQLTLANPTRSTRKVLEISGLERVFTVTTAGAE